MKETKEHIEYSKFISNIRKNNRISKCLWNDECEGNIVNAHSIQENGILSKIADNGEVYRFTYNLVGNNMETKFKKQEIRRFSTFKGFCRKHDKILFQPIEDFDFSATKEQIYLFAFRSIAKELHLMEEKILNLYDCLEISEGKSNVSAQTMYRVQLYHSLNMFKGLNVKFEKMKSRIKNKTFFGMKHLYFKMDKEYPIAANSCFIPYLGFENNMIFSQREYNEVQDGKRLPLLF